MEPLGRIPTQARPKVLEMVSFVDKFNVSICADCGHPGTRVGFWGGSTDPAAFVWVSNGQAVAHGRSSRITVRM